MSVELDRKRKLEGAVNLLLNATTSGEFEAALRSSYCLCEKLGFSFKDFMQHDFYSDAFKQPRLTIQNLQNSMAQQDHEEAQTLRKENQKLQDTFRKHIQKIEKLKQELKWATEHKLQVEELQDDYTKNLQVLGFVQDKNKRLEAENELLKKQLAQISQQKKDASL